MQMRSFLLLAILFILSPIYLRAQSSIQDSIKQTINNLFRAMKNSDTVLLRSCFAENATLQTIRKNNEGYFVKGNDLQGFTAFVGSSAKGDVDEQITFSEKILIDGPLASVWTPYKFYFKGKFSHCGVDSYQLLRTPQGWKIVYLIDTRSSDCD